MEMDIYMHKPEVSALDELEYFHLVKARLVLDIFGIGASSSTHLAP
jgi:hypothetical protein